MLLHPAPSFHNLGWIGGGCEDLCNQWIRIQGDRRHQLLHLFGSLLRRLGRWLCGGWIGLISERSLISRCEQKRAAKNKSKTVCGQLHHKFSGLNRVRAETANLNAMTPPNRSKPLRRGVVVSLLSQRVRPGRDLEQRLALGATPGLLGCGCHTGIFFPRRRRTDLLPSRLRLQFTLRYPIRMGLAPCRRRLVEGGPLEVVG